ncbi:MAG: efflux RND transporter permease subunit [Myxococcota bacterium]
MMRVVDHVLNHRWWVLFGIGCVTALAMASLSRAQIGTSMGELFFGDSPDYLTYLERSEVFASDEVVVIGIEGVDPLSTETLDRLDALTAEIWSLSRGGGGGASDEDGFDFEDDEAPEVSATEVVEDSATPRIRHILSVLNAQEMRGKDGNLEVQNFVEEAREDQANRADLLERLVAERRWGGVVVSKDGRSIALVVELQPESSRQGEQDAVFVEALMERVEQAGFTPSQLHGSGMPVVMVEVLRLSEQNLMKLTPFTGILMLLIVFLLFRQVLPAFISFVVCSLGVTWTMGFSVLLNPSISIMHSIAPVVILIVGSSDVIHLYSAYLIELEQGRDKRDAIVHACGDVGTACLYTSITTLIGFIGMSFVPTPVFRQLGIILGAGVAFTLCIAVFLVPVLQSLLPQPRAWRVGATSVIHRAFDRSFSWMARLAEHRPGGIVAAFAFALIVAVYGLTQLHIETRMVERLAEDNRVSQDQQWFRDNFSSVNMLQLHVDTGEAGGLLAPEVIEGLAKLTAELEAEPEVDTVDSLVDLHELVHEQLRPEGDDSLRPATREAYAQYTLLYEMGGGEGLDRLMDFDRQSTMMMVRLKSEAVRAGAELGDKAATRAAEIFGPKATVSPTGALYLVGGWLDELLAGQRRGLIFTFLLVGLLMCISLRSVRAGLWSMLPNMLPLLMLGGTVGLLQDETDSDTLIMAMLAIGIGVDDTIHFLMRYRIEVQRGLSRFDAIKATFDFAGRGIVMTTVVLTIGFIPLAFTDYYSTMIMGTMLPYTLFMAVFADLLLVPALARLGVFRFSIPQEQIAG